MVRQEMTLDHKIPRGRAPHLTHDLDNLVPMCMAHNMDKGSKDYDTYLDSLTTRLCK